MSHYKSNLRDVEFNLFELFNRQDILGKAPFDEVDLDTAKSILSEIERISTNELAASFDDSDRHPPVYDPAAKTVVMPDSFKKSYDAWMDAEWWRLQVPEELGGQRAPASLIWSSAEFILGSNPAIWMFACGPAFARIVFENGIERDKKIAQHMVDKRWGATMVLTEPDAGSDVGAGRTKAFPNEDGSWNIEGVKRFITSAEHDLSLIHI